MAYIFVYAIFCNFPSYTFGAWYAQKKREVRLLFTLIQGFAIPLPSRKTTEVYARYIYPTSSRRMALRVRRLSGGGISRRRMDSKREGIRGGKC